MKYFIISDIKALEYNKVIIHDFISGIAHEGSIITVLVYLFGYFVVLLSIEGISKLLLFTPPHLK